MEEREEEDGPYPSEEGGRAEDEGEEEAESSEECWDGGGEAGCGWDRESGLDGIIQGGIMERKMKRTRGWSGGRWSGRRKWS